MSPQVRFRQLRASLPGILPSLLMCDFGHLADELARLEKSEAPGLHLDVMDGQFVDNITYGFPMVEAVRRLTELPLETHLMIARPERFVDRFIEAGADLVRSTSKRPRTPVMCCGRFVRAGAAAGLAFNPDTPLSAIEQYLPDCDSVLVMSVNPGFGGQKFEPVALDKVRALRARTDFTPLVEIDGGIHEETIGPAAAAGAELYSVGSAIFRSPDYRHTIHNLTLSARAQQPAASH